MTDLLINELRQKTLEAINIAKQERERQAQLNREAAEAKARKDRMEAEEILQNLPDICRIAASRAQSQAQVMRLERGFHYHIKGYKQKLDPKELIGAASLVYAVIVRMGFEVELEFDHDGIGNRDWFNLIVKW
jgi:hypothetical protein